MSLESPPNSPPFDPEDDDLIVEGLERALVQARTKIADHDDAAEVTFPLLSEPNPFSEPNPLSERNPFSEPDVTVADNTVDSSAVMAVLREAIDRYTNGDGHEQGAWSDDHPLTATNASATSARGHRATGYAPDRRRLAAVVVVLFFLVAGFGYQSFGGSKAATVKTNTLPAATGQAVTTLTRPGSTAVVPAPTDAGSVPPDTAAPVGTVHQTTPTTAHHPATTSPPSTDPVTTDTTAPATTDTTAPATTDTTAPATTDTTTTTT